MEITFDPAKRDAALAERGLDFADAGKVMAGTRLRTRPDTRQACGEDRFQSAGYLDGRCVVIVWTPRDGTCRVISMRHCHEAEERTWFPD